MEKGRLAIHGGSPVRSSYLPYGKQWIDEDDMNAVVRCLQSDYLTTGPTVERFEEDFAQYVGSKYAVALSSGTAGLHAACFVAGLTRGDEVITSPLTFAASANCIQYVGATPVFADIDPITGNINPKEIEKRITKRTKAIIPVHFTGMPCDLAEIGRLAEEYHLTIIEDAAHALGARYKGQFIGANGDMTMFSLHPVKHITTGEGGVITTDNEEYCQKLRQFRSHGITRDINKMKVSHGPWYYEMQYLGYNYRLTDIQAALGLSQLGKLNSFLEKRREYVKLYNEAFKDLSTIDLPTEEKEYFSSWHLYIIRLRLNQLSVGRKEIFQALLKENIGVNVHYIPVHLHPYYQNQGFQRGEYPEAEKLYEEMITLPLYPAMTEQDVGDVVAAVNKVLSFYEKRAE